MANSPLPRPESVRHPELLPCPFCGGSPEMGEGENGLKAVLCLNKNCYVMGPIREEARNAASAWNRRAKVAE